MERAPRPVSTASFHPPRGERLAPDILAAALVANPMSHHQLEQRESSVAVEIPLRVKSAWVAMARI